MRSDIKILVSTHKDAHVLHNPLLYSIQVGSSLAEKRLPTIFHDDEGDNISERNRSYCELTAQYWAWKNLEADYYGFFHYRRYMIFSKAYLLHNGKKTVRKWKPYVEQADIRDDLSCYKLDETSMRKVIENSDVVTVLSEHMDVTVYEQFCQYHNKKMMDLALDVLYEVHPEFQKVAEKYLQSKYIYFLNMYIMKKDIFYSYSEWLFPVLEEFEKRVDFSELNENEMRITGYVAERLFGIYYTWLKQQTDIQCTELQYVIFHNTEPLPVLCPRCTNGQTAVSVVTATNQLFVPYLGVMLQSLVDHSNSMRTYDIIVLHTELNATDKKQLCKVSEGFSNISVRFADVSSVMKHENLSVHEHLSVETYYRYFIPMLLPDYAKVLWLDADILIKRDVAELYDLDITESCLAASHDLDFIGGYKSDVYVKKYADERMNLKQPLSYFQAGVMLLNLSKIRELYSARDFLKKTKEFNWRMMDQDVLNMLFEGSVETLPQKWNVVMNWERYGRSRFDIMRQAPIRLWNEYLEARKNPAIIHYAGSEKPWKVPDGDFSSEFWDCARKSPFYESVLYMNLGKETYNPRKKTDNRREFQLGRTKIKFQVDMNKVNQMFPAGSARRRIVRNIVKKLV